MASCHGVSIASSLVRSLCYGTCINSQVAYLTWCSYKMPDPKLHRPFRIAPFPFLPLLAAAVAVTVGTDIYSRYIQRAGLTPAVISSVARQPVASAFAAFFVLASLPAYFLFFSPSPLAYRICAKPTVSLEEISEPTGRRVQPPEE